jgi:hypothetical protein
LGGSPVTGGLPVGLPMANESPIPKIWHLEKIASTPLISFIIPPRGGLCLMFLRFNLFLDIELLCVTSVFYLREILLNI